MLKYIIGGVVLVLMGLGGFINYNRERSGACSEDFIRDFVRPELIEYYYGKSVFYQNLRDGLEYPGLTDDSRLDLESKIKSIDDELVSVELDAREVSPSTRLIKTCIARLRVNEGYAEARFKMDLNEMPGVEFEEKYAKRGKNIILLEEIQAGQVYDSVKIAKLSRRSFMLKEEPELDYNYSVAFVPEEYVPSLSVIAEIPK
ncbi:MAG: hypothetical protein CL861_07595 [Cyanobium sp. MED843]|nr:hypothetical protein [Cyanobium sp. MED843]